MDEIIAGDAVETLSYEEVVAQLIAKDKALEKANAKIVELKTSSKKTEVIEEKSAITDDEKIDLLIAEKLKKYFPEDKKEEKTDEDEQIKLNQEKTNAMSLMWDENTSGWNNKIMNVSDFDKLTPSMKKDYINKTISTHWKVVFL